MSNLKKIPKFKSDEEERNFWNSHDSADYVDWSTAKRVRFVNLKPSTKTISIRLPESMLEEIKAKANKYDVPYQSLIKIMLANSMNDENFSQRIQIEKFQSSCIELHKLLSNDKISGDVYVTEISELIKYYLVKVHMSTDELAKLLHIKPNDLKSVEHKKSSIKEVKRVVSRCVEEIERLYDVS